MRLIVGLGNPGDTYSGNRHNVGFLFLDYLLERSPQSSVLSPQFKYEKKLEAEIAKISVGEREIVLAKPQTFMNESGRAVRRILSNFQFSITNDLVVAHDDLDIRLGEYKIQRGKGPKLHNGIASIEQHVGSADFMRVRIGVDNRGQEHRIPGQRYVLADFTTLERETLQSVFDKLAGELL